MTKALTDQVHQVIPQNNTRDRDQCLTHTEVLYSENVKDDFTFMSYDPLRMLHLFHLSSIFSPPPSFLPRLLLLSLSSSAFPIIIIITALITAPPSIPVPWLQ